MTQAPHRNQAPPPGGCILDHVGFFVDEMAMAESALVRLGFQLSPFTRQMHRPEPDAPLAPAGTGNRLIVLREGYLEVLAPTGEDTPVATQLHAALARYPGLHLIAFGSADAGAHRSRLVSEGFTPLPVVDLRRTVVGADGSPAEVRFRVSRVPPGTMAEGRIQFCEHVTPEQVWRADWMEHPNGAVALDAVWVCSKDPDEAGARFARFTGCPAGPEIRTARGAVRFMTADAFAEALPGAAVPTLPFIGALRLRCRALPRTRAALLSRGVPVHPLPGGGLMVAPDDALGAALIFAESAP